MRFLLAALSILTLLLFGCGIDEIPHQKVKDYDSTPPPEATVLAAVSSADAFDFSVDNGNIVFFASGGLYSVPTAGGDLKAVYSSPSWEARNLAVAGGKVFGYSRTYSYLYSIPENGSGVVTLTQTHAAWADDVLTDGTFVYWTAGSNVYRTAVRLTPTSSVETVFEGTGTGWARIALDNGTLYASDSAARTLFAISTATLGKTKILTFSGTPPYGKAGTSIQLAVDQGHIYALLDDRYIHRVTKVDAREDIIPGTSIGYTASKISADASGVYWWDTLQNTLALKKCDSFGKITTLATIPFTWNFDATLSDGKDVYWFYHGFSPSGDDIYTVQRVPVDGGTVETVATFDSININLSGALVPRGVTYDADNLYWSSRTGGPIAVLSKSGGWPRTLNGFYSYAGITAADGFVIATNNQVISKIPVGGSSTTTLEWSIGDSTFLGVQCVATDDAWVYWAAKHNVYGEPESFDIYRKPLSGGTAVKMLNLPGHAVGIVPNEGSLYLMKGDGSDGAVSVLPKAGGEEKIVVTTKGLEPESLQIVGRTMYLLADSIRAINLDTGATKTVVRPHTTMWPVKVGNSIYVDDKNIYWAEGQYVGDAGGLYRVPIAGGYKQTLYQHASFKVAGDGSRIYWSSGDKILSLKK